MNCCSNCFSDLEIKDYIYSSGESGDCEYCHSKAVQICDVCSVGRFIMEGVLRKYEDAAESIPYEYAEDGYQFGTLDIQEILIDLEDIFSVKVVSDIDRLIKGLVDPDGTPYVMRRFFSGSGGIEEIGLWEQFCRLVKDERRFTAFLNYDSEQSTKKFIEMLNGMVLTEQRLKYLESGDKIYRARIYEEGMELDNASLSSPPAKRVNVGRMNPAGISFFYGSLKKKTCTMEVRPTFEDVVALAEFSVIKSLSVLDLSLIEEPESIFSDNYYFEFEEYVKPFLAHFISDISKPIRSSDADIEYTPTQVLTEYIRYYKDLDFDGIMFRSSLDKVGINIVLFRGPDISGGNENDRWLHFKGYEKYKITEIDIKSELVSS